MTGIVESYEGGVELGKSTLSDWELEMCVVFCVWEEVEKGEFCEFWVSEEWKEEEIEGFLIGLSLKVIELSCSVWKETRLGEYVCSIDVGFW